MNKDNILKYPSRNEAYKIWEDGIKYRQSRPYPFPLENEYRFHTQGVAAASQAIAEHVNGMDREKAFVLGLLHDYGKRINEKIENKFHGREGYEVMMDLGFPAVAQICLTHTFPNQNFDDSEYAYPQEWKDWAHQKIAKIQYDDYDYLICLCDKFFEGLSMVSIEKRTEGIAQRYNINKAQKDILYKQSIALKKYFDEKTGMDIYQILKIRD